MAIKGRDWHVIREMGDAKWEVEEKDETARRPTIDCDKTDRAGEDRR